MKYQKGDWVIHNYEIKQVTEMTSTGKVRAVSTGAFETSGAPMDDYIRPLDLRSKRIAESIEYYYNEIRKLPGSNALNYPDINRYFSSLCLQAIDDPKRDYSDGSINKFIKEAQDFFMQTRDALEGVKEVNGVRLFRN